MPMLFAGLEPDDIAGADFLDRAAIALHAAAAGGDDQRLAERVRVPGRARARLECDQGAGDASRIGRAEQRIDTNRAGKPVDGAFARWLCAAAFDVHDRSFRESVACLERI